MIEPLDVGFLVNNVGGLIGPFSPFLEYSDEVMEKNQQFNTGYALQTIRLILPKLLKKHCGGILNIGSLSALGSAYLVPYSSEKARLLSLTESLALEYGDKGVIIQCASPGRIYTPGYISKVKSTPSLDCPHPRKVAESALNMFGAGGPIVSPYWVHDIQSRALFLLGIFRFPIFKSIYTNLYKNQIMK